MDEKQIAFVIRSTSVISVRKCRRRDAIAKIRLFTMLYIYLQDTTWTETKKTQT